VTLLESQNQDPDDAQNVVRFRRALPWPYPLSRSTLGFGTGSSGDKSLDVDASESDGYGENGERKRLNCDKVKQRRQWSNEHLEST